MITYILLGLIIVLQLVVIYLFLKKKPATQIPLENSIQELPSRHVEVPFKFPPETISFSEDHEILELRDGQWCHHSWRRPEHRDIPVYSKHPRFNVKRPDGSLAREVSSDE